MSSLAANILSNNEGSQKANMQTVIKHRINLRERSKPKETQKPRTCRGRSCGNEIPDPMPSNKQCALIRCTNDNACKNKSAKRCKYCVSGLCSAKKSRKQNEKTPDTQVKGADSQKSRRNDLTRFTHVLREYRWTPGRFRETRPPGFGQCYLGRCRGDGKCRKEHRRRKRGLGSGLFSCIKCKRKKCVPQRPADRWKPLIDRFDGGLEIPRSSVSGTEKVGTLTYQIKTDINKKSFVYLDWIITHENHRSQGVARALMETLIEDIVKKDKSIKTVKLNVLGGRRNVNATALFQRFGFGWEDPDNEESNAMTLDVDKYSRYPRVQ
ncbi:acetyltransferase (GNAT) family domain-containing protein [Ditylenchus destructor]|uniref:Acetyltransferase (GNAT) family domain-containing protein n=1 Tax=Ditylenchus destructor TaxID=166010 RepID=A0AAD4QUU6_9BILA|nr:acetyltransferase (GNAT) family domain-containing protein [Ditylenchus destructor]